MLYLIRPSSPAAVTYGELLDYLATSDDLLESALVMLAWKGQIARLDGGIIALTSSLVDLGNTCLVDPIRACEIAVMSRRKEHQDA